MESPRDIVIFIDDKDFDLVEETILLTGQKLECEDNTTFATERYGKYTINNIQVDVMGSFQVNHSSGVYHYIIDKQSISMQHTIRDASIPFAALEDWFVLYQLFPKGKDKAGLIKEYLHENSVQYPYLLVRAQRGSLSQEVKDSIREMLYLH
ncbi:MAG: hypothetical protein KAQ68_07240 [Clostridiales bacterium]|nr:hypothetical protein [Clostridiales bacterium]